MVSFRQLDAYCVTCAEARVHLVSEDDPGSCTCTVCGTVQQTFKPVSV